MESSIVPAIALSAGTSPPASGFPRAPEKSRSARASLDSARGEAHSLPHAPALRMDARLQPDPSDSVPPLPHDEQQRRWFATEVLPHEPALRSWLKARFPSLADSDDVVQETYARLFRSRSTDRITNAKSYLFSTARNLAIDLFRRRQVAPMVATTDAERSAVAEERAHVADAVSSAQEFEILQDAIAALPDRCRTIMTLQKIQGLSNAEIATQLKLSINTVNAQLVIGLARCRAYLAARGVLRGNYR